MNKPFHRAIRPTMWGVAAALLLSILFASSSALAHRLNVFAWVDGDEVVAEGKFSTGKRPTSGQVDVYNGHGKLLLSVELGYDGKVRFPLPDYSSGLRIQLNTGAGHDSYWVLTPFDIESQRQLSNAEPSTNGEQHENSH